MEVPHMLDRLSSHWWLFLIRGLLALAFGLALLAFPLAGLFVIAILFGAYAFVDGILALVAATRMRHSGGSWGWLLLEGVVGIVAGICAALWPGLAVLTLAVLLGAWAIVTGVLAIASAFTARLHVPGEWLWLLSGIVSVIFGIAIFWSPAFGLFALVWMVSFYAIVAGVLLIGLSLRLRRLGTPAGAAT
jgi:uncharacterized membrane protein HdeD (DUF308 family)